MSIPSAIAVSATPADVCRSAAPRVCPAWHAASSVRPGAEPGRPHHGSVARGAAAAAHRGRAGPQMVGLDDLANSVPAHRPRRRRGARRHSHLQESDDCADAGSDAGVDVRPAGVAARAADAPGAAAGSCPWSSSAARSRGSTTPGWTIARPRACSSWATCASLASRAQYEGHAPTRCG